MLRGQLEELSSAIKEAGRNVDETEQSNEKQVKGNFLCCVHKPPAIIRLSVLGGEEKVKLAFFNG